MSHSDTSAHSGVKLGSNRGIPGPDTVISADGEQGVRSGSGHGRDGDHTESATTSTR
jgi:hypothetical protein